MYKKYGGVNVKKRILFKILGIILLFIIGLCILFCGQRSWEVMHYTYIKPMEKPTKPTWYTENKVVAHATGGIDGLDYTNSKEALLNTIENGIKVIEIDFNYTTDGNLVCYHYYNNITPEARELSLEEFLNVKIQGKYTPMIFQDVVQIMKDNPDIYISVDTKHIKLEEIVQEIVNNCKDKSVLNRFIIQCYFPGDKTKISKIYNFPKENYLYTPYKYIEDPYKVLQICYNENINVVTVKNGIWSQEILELFKNKNIYVYVYSVNRPDKVQEAFENGVHGIYTDFLLKPIK